MPTNISYDFDTQLAKALPDEKIALEELRKKLLFVDFEHRLGKNAIADAYNKNLDEWLEIKVDYTNYPNHFIERFSSLEDKTDGGPWQYNKRGVKYYVFYYKKLHCIYVFETAKLVNKMEQLIQTGVISDLNNGSKVRQKNANYHTYGYKVKKELLDDICIYLVAITL
jgi:hypothetical protein